LTKSNYAVVTLHRPSNVDTLENLQPIVEALVSIAADIPVLMVAHPRTIKSLRQFGLDKKLIAGSRVTLLDPLPYIRFMNVVTGARLVITDSGGLQEETTYLNIPCLTLRENTERPVTVSEGTNTVVGVDPARIVAESRRARAGEGKAGRIPALWDGRASERIAEVFRSWLSARRAA
jgi:UDP-N-acetylglucosamine 2-epimerase (non-hydrolysing)